mgnify:FL=1
MTLKTLTKVELTYSDGSIDWLEGQDAEEWLTIVNGAFMMDAIHGDEHAEMDKLSWKSKKPLESV